MKKKILALSCSPSKGRNSDTMLDNFVEGIKKTTDESIEIEKVYLTDIPIDMYTYENGSQPASYETEFYELAMKFKYASGVIIATPTYNFAVPAGLKNFVDRIRFIALDLSRKNKFNQPVGLLRDSRLFFLVSGGTPKWAQKILFFAFPPFWLRSVFLYYGSQCMGAFYSGDIKTMENEKILKKCEKLGEKFGKEVSTGKGNGMLEKIFWRPPQKT